MDLPRTQILRIVYISWLGSGPAVMAYLLITGRAADWLWYAVIWLVTGMLMAILGRSSDMRLRRKDVVEFATLIVPLAIGQTVQWWVGSRVATLEFHVVAAQVIPILILALVYQERAFSVARSHVVVDGIYMLGIFFVIAVGEAYALGSIYAGEPSRSAAVAGSLAVAFSFVAARAFVSVPRGEHS